MKVKYKDRIYPVLAIDFEGIIIRKGEPSVIVKENDGCIPLSECELIYSNDNVKPIKYNDGEPCIHTGCLSHQTHPCEGCGRIGGKGIIYEADYDAEIEHFRSKVMQNLTQDLGIPKYYLENICKSK